MAPPSHLFFHSPQLFRAAGWPCVKVSFWDIAGTANMSNERIKAMAPEIEGSKELGSFLRVSENKDYSALGSLLGSPSFGKLSFGSLDFRVCGLGFVLIL